MKVYLFVEQQENIFMFLINGNQENHLFLRMIQ